MSGEHVKWGILSAAKIAREWVAPAIHASATGRIQAIASLTPGKAAALAGPYGDVALHDSYEALLVDDDVDAIYIPLPNSAHVEWTRKCLEAGKHVLCEKPIALNAAEIDELIALRDRTGLVAAEAFMVTHHPQWQRVREILNSGEIGRLVQVQGSFSFYNDDADNIRNMPDQGGGALRDIGVYPSVTTRFATGQEPLSASSQITWDNGIDATARTRVAFEGFSLEFYVSMRMAPRQEMVFHGTDGWLRVNTPFNAHLYGDEMIDIRMADGAMRSERFPRAGQYVRQIEAFNASVKSGAEFACPLEFSRGNQRMIDMIYAASPQA